MAMALSSCAVSHHLPEDGYLLDKVRVVSEENPALAASLKSKVRQRPNRRFLGIVRLPMRLYCLAGRDDSGLNRLLKRVGEAPSVYDQALTEQSCAVLEQVLANKGYLRAEVVADTVVTRRTVEVDYYVDLNRQYRISDIKYQVRDSALLAQIYADTVNSILKVGMPLDVNELNSERSRLTAHLQNHGYYSFNKDYITYMADTARNSSDVELTVRVRSGQAEPAASATAHDAGVGLRRAAPLKPYTIGEVCYQLYPASQSYQRGAMLDDTLHYDGSTFVYDRTMAIRPQVLRNASLLEPGMLYDARKVKDTYTLYGRLGALKYTNIGFTELNDSVLQCNVALRPAKKVSVGAELDVTNTAGDFGVSAALAFTNRNLFRGSEVLSVKLRGAYENITHLSDYADRYFLEYGADVGLNFPRFIVPFVSNEVQRRSKATTQLELQYNMQRRPEFDRTCSRLRGDIYGTVRPISSIVWM